MTVRDLIFLVKKREKCTQKDIANTLGIADSYLSDTINGKRKPAKTIRQLLENYPYLREEINKKSENTNNEITPINNEEREKFLNLLTNQQKMIMDLQEQLKIKDEIINKYIKK